jgi:hypothetical protein
MVERLVAIMNSDLAMCLGTRERRHRHDDRRVQRCGGREG